MATNRPPSAPSRLNYDASSKAIQQRPQDDRLDKYRSFFDARMAEIAKYVTQGVRPEALVRFVLRDMEGERGKALRTCSSESVYLGLLACAVTGLEPGSLKGEAYLVPFKGEATFIAGWKGLVKQARRSREVVGIRAEVVYEGDEFDVDLGSANRVVHRPRFGQRGENIIAAYAIARMAHGSHDEIELMDRSDLDAIRKAAHSGNSPAWRDWPDQMMRKAPIRRLCKRLPLGSDYYVGEALDDAADVASQRRIIDLETRDAGSRALEQGAESAEMAAQASDPTEAELAAHDAKLNRMEGNQ